MFWASTLHTQRHGYSGHLDFVAFVGNLSFHAINLNAVSLFADSFFFVLVISDILFPVYFINLNEWIYFLVKKSLHKKRDNGQIEIIIIDICSPKFKSLSKTPICLFYRKIFPDGFKYVKAFGIIIQATCFIYIPGHIV